MSEQDFSEMRARAESLLLEIEDFHRLAEEHCRFAETARKNANSEELFAINAKRVCEEHSTAISNIKGTAESELTQILNSKQTAETFTASIPASKADIQAIAEIRKELESQLNTALQQIPQKLQSIEEFRDAAEAAQKEAKDFRDAATQARSAALASQTEAEQAAKRSGELMASITNEQGNAARAAGEASAMATVAKQEKQELDAVLKHLQESDIKSTAYEERVSGYSQKLEELIAKIEGLLPGAASASLASSFLDQRKRFKASQKWWVLTFATCIVALVGVSTPSFVASFGKEQLTWEALLRGLITRLPVVIPLVWLAIYAGRNYMLALRLEEDYAYKESISVAFEGYKREMSEIVNGDPSNPSALTTLCTNVLRAISERPGRIYDGKVQDITPMNELHTSFRQAGELANKKVSV